MGRENRTYTIPPFLSFFPLNILKSELFKPHLCSKPAKSTRTIYRKKIKSCISFYLFEREKMWLFMILHCGTTWNFVSGITETKQIKARLNVKRTAS